jgi:hypothetical protein
MIKKTKFLILGLIALGLSVGGYKAAAQSIDFSILPVLPSNQSGENPHATYFDLLMSQGTSQNVVVKVTNVTNHPITIDTSVAPASTTQLGQLTLTNAAATDTSMQYNLKNQVTMPSEIVVPAGQTTDVTATVTMPNATFHGIIAGGLLFKEKPSSESSSSSTQGLSITNEYQYAAMFLMRQTIDPAAPVLNLGNVSAGQLNARNAVLATLENSAPYFLNNMNVQAEVTGLTNKNLKYSYNNSEMQMAPNSNFDLSVPISQQGVLKSGQYSQPLQAGKYQLALTVYGQEAADGQYAAKDDKGKLQHYKYKWTFSPKSFTVTAAQAKKLNKADPSINHSNAWIFWMIGGIVAVLVTILVFFFAMKRRKQQQTEFAALKAANAELEEKLKEINNK